MKKHLQKLLNGMRKVANSLSDDARSQWDEMSAAVEALIADEAEHNVTELNDKIAEIEAKYAKNNEEVAERIQAVKNELFASLNAGKKNVADKFTPEVREQIAAAIKNSTKAGQEAAIMAVCKKNDITGVSFPEVLKIAVSFERKPTELFDEFGVTDIDQHYLVGIDESNSEQIAKQFSDDPDVQKDIQTLAATGVKISTDYIGKLQRFSSAALDKAEKAGVLNDVINQTTAELEYMTKRLAEKTAIVGDNVNPAGKKVTTFETIGTVAASDGRITVVNPATAGQVDILDLATAADAVEGSPAEKVAVLDKSLVRALSAFYYGQGATPKILTDDELAAQMGVRKIIKVDYMSEVQGLHAVILRPSAYKVQTLNEHALPWSEWRNNAHYFIYERNMGGALCELKAAAVLREAE